MNPYHQISEFWGEELSSELVERIADAPRRHIDRFRDSRPSAGMSQLPPLPRGHLRPIVVPSVPDSRRGYWAHKEMANLAAGLLLYAHEIVVPTIHDLVYSEDSVDRRFGASWLMGMKPLHEAGLLHFRAVASAKIHPSRRSVASELAESLSRESIPEVEQLALSLWRMAAEDDEFSSDYDSFRFHVLDELASDALFFESTSWTQRAHRLFRTKAERALSAALTNHTSGCSPDKRLTTLKQLTELLVPSPAADVRSLVQLRQHDEIFADWRHALASALGQVEEIDLADRDRIEAARSVLIGELEEPVSRLNAKTRKSSVRGALFSGMREFAITSASAFAPLAAAHVDPVASVLGAAGAGAAELGIHYGIARRETDPTSLRQRVVLSYFSHPPFAT